MAAEASIVQSSDASVIKPENFIYADVSSANAEYHLPKT